LAIEEPSYVAAVRHLLQSTSQGSGTSQTNSTEGGTGSTAAGESAAGVLAEICTAQCRWIGLHGWHSDGRAGGCRRLALMQA